MSITHNCKLPVSFMLCINCAQQSVNTYLSITHRYNKFNEKIYIIWFFTRFHIPFSFAQTIFNQTYMHYLHSLTNKQRWRNCWENSNKMPMKKEKRKNGEQELNFMTIFRWNCCAILYIDNNLFIFFVFFFLRDKWFLITKTLNNSV